MRAIDPHERVGVSSMFFPRPEGVVLLPEPSCQKQSHMSGVAGLSRDHDCVRSVNDGWQGSTTVMLVEPRACVKK